MRVREFPRWEMMIKDDDEEIEKVSEVVNAPMHIYVTPFALNERYKLFFLRTLSHILRGPVSVIVKDHDKI